MAAPFLLLQLSDPHIGATWTDIDANPAERLAAAVDTVLRLPDRPDAVLVSGDLAEDGGDESYRVVAEQLARLDAPSFVLPGNHDDREALRRSFDVPGSAGEPVQYAVDLGPLRLVLMDSTVPGESHGELDGPRLAWLDAELSSAPGRPTIVALHHPPFQTGSPAWDAIGLVPADRVALGAVLERHPHVRRVVAGHVHRTIVAGLAGRVVLSAPSTYAQGRLDLHAAELAVVDEPPGFALHALLDGEITSHVQPVS